MTRPKLRLPCARAVFIPKAPVVLGVNPFRETGGGLGENHVGYVLSLGGTVYTVHLPSIFLLSKTTTKKQYVP